MSVFHKRNVVFHKRNITTARLKCAESLEWKSLHNKFDGIENGEEDDSEEFYAQLNCFLENHFLDNLAWTQESRWILPKTFIKNNYLTDSKHIAHAIFNQPNLPVEIKVYIKIKWNFVEGEEL